MVRALKVLGFVVGALLMSGCGSSHEASLTDSSPPPGDIFGNSDYRAISYGGYRELTRDEAPSLEQVVEDMKILSAMGIKLLRTYNTSQYPLAALTLDAISRIKEQDPSFEMYVMLGVWIEARNAWAEGVWKLAEAFEEQLEIGGCKPWTMIDHAEFDVAERARACADQHRSTFR